MELEETRALTDRLRQQVARVIVGQGRVVDLLLVALLSKGHVLMEGVPGTAKTLLTRTFAAGLELAFQRIQFTPDLMPGDVLGTNLFNFQSGTFSLTRGPVFTDVLLADEINRTPPKTQAALLQAMQERAVTIDGKTHALGDDFLVIATQNPIEQEGTYPLPEAQLDRFLLKIGVGYPSRNAEREMVRRHGHRSATPDLAEYRLEAVAERKVLGEVRLAVASIRLSDEIGDYVVDLVRATRKHPRLAFGASPRAANMLSVAARASAALDGRDFVIPDDVKRLAKPVLAHRLVTAPDAQIEGISAEGVLESILGEVPAPR